jgi:hypothetical protein
LNCTALSFLSKLGHEFLETIVGELASLGLGDIEKLAFDMLDIVACEKSER